MRIAGAPSPMVMIKGTNPLQGVVPEVTLLIVDVQIIQAVGLNIRHRYGDHLLHLCLQDFHCGLLIFLSFHICVLLALLDDLFTILNIHTFLNCVLYVATIQRVYTPLAPWRGVGGEAYARGHAVAEVQHEVLDF